MASLAERLYGTAPTAAPRNRFAAAPEEVAQVVQPYSGQAPLANMQPGQFFNMGNANNQGTNLQPGQVVPTPNVPVWTPPQLDANGHFTSQQDIDDFKAAMGNSGMSQHIQPGSLTGATLSDPQAFKNNKAAGDWAQANNLWHPPAGGHGGIRGAAKDFGDSVTGYFKNVILSPPVLAALTAGVGAAAGAGAGAAEGGAAAGETAGAEGIAAGQAAGLTTDQLLAQSAAGLSVATPAETAAALGAGTEVATAGAAGAGTQFGGTTQSAAGDAGATGGGSKGAAAYLATAKDVAGLALTGLGLAAATGAVGPGASQSPPDATPPPQDQVSSVDQQGVAQADNAGQRFPNLGGSGDDTLFNGASGIDPFMLNLGRAKLLGQ